MSTFLNLVETLLTDPEAKAQYSTDPDGYLAERGFSDFDQADISDALQFSADTMPAPVAAEIDPSTGLGSVAGTDLEGLGLTLEREPIDPGDLDSQPFGHDSDLDAGEAPSLEADFDPADSIDEIEIEPKTVGSEEIQPTPAAVDAEVLDDLVDSHSSGDIAGLEPIDSFVEQPEVPVDDADWAGSTNIDEIEVAFDLPDDLDLDGLI